MHTTQSQYTQSEMKERMKRMSVSKCRSRVSLVIFALEKDSRHWAVIRGTLLCYIKQCLESSSFQYVLDIRENNNNNNNNETFQGKLGTKISNRDSFSTYIGI